MKDILTADWNWINAAAGRFERAWKTGPRPRIEDFLAEVAENQRAALLTELLCVERELRQGMGENPTSAEYRRRFPEHEVVVASVFDSGLISPTATGPVSRSRSIRPESASVPAQTGPLPEELANLPDYRIIRKLGIGGMGVVFLAHNRLLGRDEILKVMGQNIVKEPGVRERFLGEIRAVGRLRHPNIVSAYSAFRCGESVVFAMEYVEGLDLARMVKAKGPLPVAHVCYFGNQAAMGLQHAHEQGLVHRDIKPSNLMLSRQGDRPVIKLLDFGLAKASSEHALIVPGQDVRNLQEKASAALTNPGVMLGTPDFVAPEQIVDAQKADIRADIYGLGCTLYYLLSGRAPFQTTAKYDVLQAHQSLDATLLNLVRPEVPVELAALVSKMMAKEPGQRFQTPAEVAQALVPFFNRKAAASAAADHGATQEVLRAAIPFADEVTETATAVVRSAAPTTVAGMQNLMSVPEEIGATTVEVEQKECGPPAQSSADGSRQRTRRELAFTAVGFASILLGTVLVVAFERRQHRSSFTVENSLVSGERSEGQRPEGPSNPAEAAIDPNHGERSDAVTVLPGTGADSKRDHVAGPKVINPQPLDKAQGAGPPGAVQVSTDKTSRQVGSHNPVDTGPAKFLGPVANESLSWSGAVYIVRTEERVYTKAYEVRQRLTEYQHAFLELRNLESSMTREQAAAADLTRQIEALSQDEVTLGGILAQLKNEALVVRRTRDEMETSRMTFYLDGDGNGMSIDGLNQRLAALTTQIEQCQARIDLTRDQSKKLAIGQQRRAPSQPVVVTKVRVELDLWHAYTKALSALRESVDATTQRYGELADNAKVRAELTSKNAGLPQPKFLLGPSQQFRDIERTLKAHEDFVKSRNARGIAKPAITPEGGLPPDFEIGQRKEK